jgi:hypothetical protein
MLDENGDAPVIRALPQSERLATRGEVLYGVFITLANNGPRTRPMSRRFALMDDDQHSFRQIPLRRDSPYAYRAGDLAAGRISPADGSAPAENLAEQGYPLVFRVPRGDASDGLLVLRVFDPTGATAPQDIIVQAL